MGFDWDAYASGGDFIKADEKKVLAENGIPFKITGIRVTNKFDGTHNELTVILPDSDEERVLSFPIGSGAESRDNMLAGLKEHLDSGGEPEEAKLEKVGRAYFLRPAVAA